MIDTVLLCGGDNRTDWDRRPLEGPNDTLLAENYWQWIEEQLRQATFVFDVIVDDVSSNRHRPTIVRAPYLIVSGHFPVYSVAEHGPTQCLVDRLRPLLHQYRATTYLCGHDHNLQVSQQSTSPVCSLCNIVDDCCSLAFTRSCQWHFHRLFCCRCC
jgi:tartrate-resistant acid phosphatase type 5